MTNKILTFETMEDYIYAVKLLVESSTANFHGYRKDGHWVIEFDGSF